MVPLLVKLAGSVVPVSLLFTVQVPLAILMVPLLVNAATPPPVWPTPVVGPAPREMVQPEERVKSAPPLTLLMTTAPAEPEQVRVESSALSPEVKVVVTPLILKVPLWVKL